MVMPEDLETNDGQETLSPKKFNGEEIFWEDYEYDFEEKTTDWFWILGTIAVLAIIISVILKDFLFALIIFLGAFILGTHAKRPPKTITYGLTKNGVKHGDLIFFYNNIRSFWVDNDRNRLVIETSRMIKPHIYIPLDNADREEVRKKLLEILKEQEYHGSFSDIVAEFFGI